jgi:predicted negative regulator of RcsB-dependent stress response
MKSAHRHELETNALAHKLELYIERYKEYGSWIIGGLIAIVLIILLASYLTGMSAAHNSEAWDTFNHAITSTGFGSQQNLTDLRTASTDNPGTSLQQIADTTWADAQVFNAGRTYLANRPQALEMLGKAESTYESVLRSTSSDALKERAHLGLARVYEMQNKLDKAKDEYGKISGTYAAYAKVQAERLAKPETQEAYTWLATAQLPLPKAPAGPGIPGQHPEFSPGELNLPAAGPPAAPPKAEDTKAANDAFDALLKSLKDDGKKGETPDRYKEGEKPAGEKADTSKAVAPAAGESPAADKGDTKPADKPAEKPADKSSK